MRSETLGADMPTDARDFGNAGSRIVDRNAQDVQIDAVQIAIFISKAFHALLP